MKRRANTLIKSPLDWQMASAPVPHPAFPVLAERGGTQLRTPRGTVVVDTREQNPFDFCRFEGWFASVEHRALKLGDYSIAGLEDICVVERKDLTDLVHSFTATRSVFIDRLKRMSSYPHRLLVVTAPLSQLKSPYPQAAANPNRIFQSLIAMLAGWSIPFARRRTHWERKRSLRTYIRCTSTVGSKPTTTDGFWPTLIFSTQRKRGVKYRRPCDERPGRIFA